MTPFEKTDLIKAGAYDWYGIVKSIILILTGFEDVILAAKEKRKME